MKKSGLISAGNVLVRNLSRGVLWIGLALCAYAIWEMLPQVAQARARIQSWQVVIIPICLMIIWALTVAAWRLIVLAFTSTAIPWSSAFRQSGLLLVGKYIPGGVFGFMARAHDGDAAVSARRHLAAGAYEQTTALLITTATGAVLYLGARLREPWWLIAIFLVPYGVAAVLPTLGSALSRVRGLQPVVIEVGKLASSRTLLCALFLQQLAVMSWMGIVVIVATGLYGLEWLPAIGVAGAFSLGISAGLLVLIAPGGIGIRESAFAGLAVAFLPWQAALVCAAMLRMIAMVLDVCAGGIAAFIGAARDTHKTARGR